MAGSGDAYVMPSFAILAVHDPAASARWYREALGFAPVFELPGPAGQLALVHLRRARYQDLLLVPAPPDFGAQPGEPGRGITLAFTVDEDIDHLAGRARAAGAQILAGPVDRPWNVRELVVADLDGYRLAFSRVIDPSRTFTAVMEDAQRGLPG